MFWRAGLSDRDMDEISNWIIESGLRGRPETDIIEGVCQRL